MEVSKSIDDSVNVFIMDDISKKVSTNDSKEYDLPQSIFQHMFFKDNDIEGVLPLPNINSKDFDIILKYLENGEKEGYTKISPPLKTTDFNSLIKPYEKDFFNKIIETKNKEDNEFKAISIMATNVNYLGISVLLDLIASKLGSMIKDKSVDEVQNIILGQSCKFTKEDEENLIKMDHSGGYNWIKDINIDSVGSDIDTKS